MDLSLDHPISFKSQSCTAYFLRSNLELVWVTYFGGQDVEIGSALSYSGFDDRLYFASSTSTNNLQLPPTSGGRLPVWDFDQGNSDDYFQEEPFSTIDRPTWVGFFDVSLIDSPFLNTKESEIDINSITIFPNPSLNGEFNISSKDELIEEVIVYDLSGKIILHKDINRQYEVRVNLNNVSDGLFLVKIRVNDKVYTKKLIKQ